MPVTKLIVLMARIFLYSAAANTGIFFIAVYANTVILNTTLPVGTHVLPTFNGAFAFALYTGLQLSLFFTTFILLIVRLSIFTGVVLTLRDIAAYYKKFVASSVVVMALLVCSLCAYFSNTSQNRQDIAKGLMGGDIVTYAMPCFWLVLLLAFYRSYQLKLNEPDGSKDRSWLEGNIEK
jgi:hypothetical protein